MSRWTLHNIMKKDLSKAAELKEQGLSYRKIAQELKVSKSTVANYFNKPKAKFSMPDNNPILEGVNLNTMHVLPPAGGLFTVPDYLQYSGIFRGGNNYYLPPDIAIRDNRDNARNMWNNLLIREPLQSRLWAVAEQEWHIEPEDKKDQRQVEIANKIQKLMENIPDFLKMRYSLLKSRWFGVYGVQSEFSWNTNKELTVKRWSELHGDSLSFKMNSDEVGVYIAATGGISDKKIESEAGYIGRVHRFDESTIRLDEHGEPYQVLSMNERQAVIIMSYDPQAADFLDPRSAGGVKGLGLRSTCYPVWLQMTTITGWMIDWLERFGTGITIYRFLRGNEASYLAAKQLAESQDASAAVMMPVDMTTGIPVEGIQRIEPSPIGLDNVLKVIQDFFAPQLRRFIVGQDATSMPMTAGLGSEIADVQQNTFFRVVKFDSIDLQETLTRQLVRVIQDWSYPGTPPCKFVIDFTKPNTKEQLESIKAAWDMGVSFIEDEVRSLVGLTKPTEEDVTISNKQQPESNSPQSNPLAGIVPTQEEEETPFKFRFQEDDEEEEDDFELDEQEPLSDEEIQELGQEAMAEIVAEWQRQIEEGEIEIDEEDKVLFAKSEGNPNHDNKTGQFTSGGGSSHKSDDKKGKNKSDDNTSTKENVREISKDVKVISKDIKELKPNKKVKRQLEENAQQPAAKALGMTKDALLSGLETTGKVASLTYAVGKHTYQAARKTVAHIASRYERIYGKRGAILILSAGILGSAVSLWGPVVFGAAAEAINAAIGEVSAKTSEAVAPYIANIAARYAGALIMPPVNSAGNIGTHHILPAIGTLAPKVSGTIAATSGIGADVAGAIGSGTSAAVSAISSGASNISHSLIPPQIGDAYRFVVEHLGDVGSAGRSVGTKAKELWDWLPENKKQAIMVSFPLVALAVASAGVRKSVQGAVATAKFPYRAFKDLITTGTKRKNK